MMTLRDLDGAISDTALQEQAVVCQNMFLMEQAIGLGGGIHSVGSGRHLLGWEPQVFPGLGFSICAVTGNRRSIQSGRAFPAYGKAPALRLPLRSKRPSTRS